MGEIDTLHQGISQAYIFNNDVLVEPNENMKVPLYKREEQVVVISPNDDERKGIWVCFLKSFIK